MEMILIKVPDWHLGQIGPATSLAKDQSDDRYRG
jgi:hypothetical protein